MGLYPTDQSIIVGDAHDNVNYPNLNLDVFIVGNCFRSGAIAMFAKAGCRGALSIEDADLVCFLGGEDVDPRLYGQEPLDGTYFSSDRDQREAEIFAKCLSLGIPMFGICRGMQLIHVLNGGQLYQHVQSHGREHDIVEIKTARVLRASSMHHQMCIEDDKSLPVAYAKETVSGQYWSYRDGKVVHFSDKKKMELEAAYYPDINAFAVQGHPEVGGYEQFTRWCMERVGDLVADVEEQMVVTTTVKEN